MRTSIGLLVIGAALVALTGCGGDGEAPKVSPDKPCELLTDAEVTAASGIGEQGSPWTEGLHDGWECRWRRPAAGRDSWELRLITQNNDGGCYTPPGAVPAPDLDPTAFISTETDSVVAVERNGTCMRLYADSDTPEGNGTGISVEENRELTEKAMERLR
ncbi:hypothetical protein Aph02nite_42490 [Actinoplanes philippinensis]|nr:hypothetical protein [Actinoplanes philippinensis]GIE78299.1 hypothetical protein Aph02nite_42490 [Actinoplanes philippinensis]